jgi:hypothetical protein
MNSIHRNGRAQPGFFTFKSTRPVPVRGPLSEDLLVQASLDPSVERIGYCAALTIEGRAVPIEAPIFHREDGACVVAVLDEPNPDRDPDADRVAAAIAAHSMRLRAVTPADVMREPLATTARVIWRQRHTPVDLAMRLAFSHAMADVPSLTVDELCRAVPGPRNPVPQLMTLACAGLLRIDLAHGFNGNTPVRGPR